MILKTKIPIFDVWIHFVDDPADVRPFIEGLSDDPSNIPDGFEHWRGFVHDFDDRTGYNHRMLCCFDKDTTLNTVVHEAVHAAWLTLRFCNMIVKPNTGEEPLCYVTAWLVEEMMAFLGREGADAQRN